MAQRTRGRAANREGSVFRTAKGWRGKAFSGYDTETGAPKYRWFSGKTQADVLAAKNAFEVSFSLGQVTSVRAGTLLEWSKVWLESEKTKLAPRTWDYYDDNLRIHILPLIGGLRLDEIRPVHVERVILSVAAKKTKKGMNLSPRTQQAAFATLRTILADAVKADLIANNPALRVDGPKQDPTTPEALTAEQVRSLLTNLAESPARGPLLVNLLLGCRISETLGVRWADVDLKKRTVAIRGQLARRDGKYVYVPVTKTREGRTLALPNTLVEVMKAEKARQQSERYDNPLGLVFLNRNGNPWDKHNIGDFLHKAQVSAKLPQCGTHVLRHTAATIALAAGIDIHAVAKQLGHKNTRLTADLYGQATLDRSRAVASQLEASFLGTEKKPRKRRQNA